MKPERWQQISHLYHSVAERSEADRAAYLDQACAGDPDLRREVESLLAHQDGASLLESPALDLVPQGLTAEPALPLVGRNLGPYHVLAPIGAGGMGQVYRARDATLARDVALKLLPDPFAHDPDRLARFRREALHLAALNHPNIATIHGLEEADGISFLVLELVPGQTLAARLASGPLPLESALRICAQVGLALEAAHDKGILHRDLKPANIQITPDDRVKVLDFGLAKSFSPEPSDPSRSPTLSHAATGEGIILGTAAYMSPEQARGQPLDRRSDLWSFGCVLYESLTGRRAFPAETVSDTIAHVLDREPDWNALPAKTPANIRTLLRRCLEKNPARRLRDAGDARIEIEDTLATPETAAPAATLRSRGRVAWMVAAAALAGAVVAGIAVWMLMRAPGPPSLPVARVRVDVAPAEGITGRWGDRPPLTAIALSPNGRSIVFSGTRGTTRQLYLRPLEASEATPIRGTEGAEGPFFSPDGRWIGFWVLSDDDTELKKVALDGGLPVTVCKGDFGGGFGATWGPNDSIVFGTMFEGLYRVAASGGKPQPLTTVDTAKGEHSHRFPHLLPDGRAVIFTVTKAINRWDDAQIVVRSLATGEQRVLVTGADARYVPTGHLVYARVGTLMAVPFDLGRLAVTGGEITLVEEVMQAINRVGFGDDTGAAQFSISETGALAYLPGGIQPGRKWSLVWVDRSGAREPLLAELRAYAAPRLSPDGRRVAFTTIGLTQDVWIHDVGRGATTLLTEDGHSVWSIWTPDSKRVTFQSNSADHVDLAWRPADASRPVERLTKGDRVHSPSSWSGDGRTLAFVRNGDDISLLSLETRKWQGWLETASYEAFPEFSPDGRWVAYASDESGRPEVYARPYPGPGGREQISTEEGREPAWSRDGREICYIISKVDDKGVWHTKMMAVDVTTAPKFAAGKPRMLFEGPYRRSSPVRGYDVAPDGRRFLMVDTSRDQPPPPATEMILVLNWFEELKRLAAPRAR